MSCRQRDAATHTARLQVGWYIIFMASEGGGGEVVGRWWRGGGEVAGRWRGGDGEVAGRWWSDARDNGPWFKSQKNH